MSVVKQFQLQCDACRCRLEWSMELVANYGGITKGNGTADLRREAKEALWERRKISPKVWIDLCPACALEPTPDTIWFKERQ